jgi:hypothetical protein
MASDITGLGPRCGHKAGDIFTIRHVLLKQCQPIFTIILQELESITPRIAAAFNTPHVRGVASDFHIPQRPSTFESKGADCRDAVLCTLYISTVTNSG